MDALYTTSLRFTKNCHQAEDLVQETCLKAWTNRSQLKTPQTLKGWLFKILMNTFINTYRRNRRKSRVIDVELTEEMLERAYLGHGDHRADPETLLMNRCLDEEIEEAYDQLHAEIRAVVWLSDVEGFRQHEIAEILGCPPGTVASRLFRGRTMLRELLHNYAKRRGLIKE
jgi:RNA polymerase sigma-70 factor (ECF subfamily)